MHFLYSFSAAKFAAVVLYIAATAATFIPLHDSDATTISENLQSGNRHAKRSDSFLEYHRLGSLTNIEMVDDLSDTQLLDVVQSSDKQRLWAWERYLSTTGGAETILQSLDKARALRFLRACALCVTLLSHPECCAGRRIS